MSRVERIADDVLVLADSVPVDGRVSWLPLSARGYESYNEYAVLSETRVLLIDTGVALHGPSLLPTLKEIVGTRELVVFATRIELDSIGNLASILDAFPQAQVATTIPIPPTGLVHIAQTTPSPRSVMTLRPGDSLEAVGFPRLRTTRPLIQTLGTIWLKDAESETLFTTDMFCAEMLPDAGVPVIQRTFSPSTTPRYVREALLSKFDWLAIADLPPLAEQWDRFFNGYTPAAIAPIHGRVVCGHDLVRRTIEVYRAALFGFAQAVA